MDYLVALTICVNLFAILSLLVLVYVSIGKLKDISFQIEVKHVKSSEYDENLTRQAQEANRESDEEAESGESSRYEDLDPNQNLEDVLDRR